MVDDLSLTLFETLDAEEGVIRMDPLDMRLLGVQSRDVVAVHGKRVSYAQVFPSCMEERNQRLACVHPDLARNVGLGHTEKVRISYARVPVKQAESVMLYVDDEIDRLHVAVRLAQLSFVWQGRIVVADDLLSLPTLDQRPLYVHVKITKPADVVQITSQTIFTVALREEKAGIPVLAGLRDSYKTCESLVQSRLKDHRTGAAHSILLMGPSGCGKAKLVQRLALDLGVSIVSIDAQAILDKMQANPAASGAGAEYPLGLADLARKAPCVLLFDHLEALAFECQTDHVVRQAIAYYCGLLDDIRHYPNLFIIGCSSAPLPERFRRHTAFDITLPVDAPNRLARQEIMMIATKDIPLADGVDLVRLSEMTSGAVARDLFQLTSTASALAVGSKVEMNDFVLALRSLRLTAANDVRCDIPSLSWNEIAGLDDMKQLLRETILWSLRYYDKFAQAGIKPPRSVLLSGAPGTGKTSLVRALAGFIPMNYIEVDCPLLAAFDFEKAVQFIRDTFALARRKTPCLVFFDDIDVLFDIGSVGAIELPNLHPIVAQLLAELDELSVVQGIVVFAATNRPDRLSKEVLREGRFDYAVTLPMPDLQARKKIIQIHARKLPLTSDVDFDHLAASTQGMAPSEIATLCSRVGLMALRPYLNREEGRLVPPVVNSELFEQCMRGRKN